MVPLFEGLLFFPAPLMNLLVSNESKKSIERLMTLITWNYVTLPAIYRSIVRNVILLKQGYACIYSEGAALAVCS